MAKKLILVLGGARSGKSRYAENWAQANGQQILFVATAQALDEDMQHRIARHRAERPNHWQTVEAPLGIGASITHALQTFSADLVIVDCLTLLATNALLTLPDDPSQANADAIILEEVSQLLTAYENSSATWLVISNEVGMGIVPPYHLGRVFRDSLGRANQTLAQAADEVVLLVAGLPWHLKG